MVDSPFSTPKRKHSQLLDGYMPDRDSTQFTFALDSPFKDGSASPRSSFAIRFRGLDLGGEGGGGVPSGGRASKSQSQSPETNTIGNYAFAAMHGDAENGTRKRMRMPDVELADAEASDPHATQSPTQSVPKSASPRQHSPFKKSRSQSPRQHSPKSIKFALDTAVVEQTETVAHTNPTASPSRARAAESLVQQPAQGQTTNGKPRNGKRAGTPPLTAPANRAASQPEETVITDPLRASLTWHDDEITIYDPDDSDDDGTGINGIGFKPTPAIAYARTVKRKQQLAEYRKREEREARAKRSQRRRGSPISGLVELKGSVERRRVRFMESATELISF